MRPIDLNPSVEGLLPVIRSRTGEGIELLWRPGHEPAMAAMTMAHLEHLLGALADRAQKRLDGQAGRMVIEVSVVRDLDEAGFARGTVPEGFYVLLAVGDTGHGPAEEAPGYAPSEEIATVRAIAARCRGHVFLEEHAGHGSVCRLLFPHDQPAPAPAVDRSTPGNIHILLVDDQWTIAQPVTSYLVKAGFQVSVAADAEEAMAMHRETTRGFDLLLTDIVLPGRNGIQLYEALRTRQPNLKCLFMSGFSGESVGSAAYGTPPSPFIAKPFSQEELLGAIQEAWSGPGGTKPLL